MSSESKGTYRNTAQRAIILEEVENAEGHLTAGEIFERVKRRYPSIAYGTVYRTLHLLADVERVCDGDVRATCCRERGGRPGR